MPLTAESFRQQLKPYLSSNSRLLVAYSGGVDSHVLLHLCEQVALTDDGLTLNAVYIHHGLHDDADRWAEHCERTCYQLKIPFSVLYADVKPTQSESTEALAREARYSAFQSLLGKNDLLLTAHHQDDQAETLLLQLFRGCGVKGLAGMPAVAGLGEGKVVRPFLSVQRSEILNYARQHKLSWIEDPSNAEENFDRNFLRQTVLPMLESRWPSLSNRLARTGAHCAEATDLLDKVADDLLSDIDSDETGRLPVNWLMQMPLNERKLLLRRWVQQAGLRLPSTKLLNTIEDNVLKASEEASPFVNLGEFQIRRYRNELYLVIETGADNFDHQQRFAWDGKGTFLLPDGTDLLSVKKSSQAGIDAGIWETGAIEIRFRTGGEKIQPLNRSGSHSLKNLFQEAAIPPWQRESWPLVFIDGRLAVIPGICVASWCAQSRDGVRVEIDHIKNN